MNRTMISTYLKRSYIFSAILFVLLAVGAAARAEAEDAGPFRQGSLRLSLIAGGGTAFDQNYTIFGLGAGYYVADDLEVGLDAEDWTGNTPRIYRYSPQLRYVISTDETVRPYIGAFYRRTVIEGYRDNDAVGARAGVFFLSGRSAYFGVGLAEDVYLNCDRTVYSSCTEIYPELSFAVVF